MRKNDTIKNDKTENKNNRYKYKIAVILTATVSLIAHTFWAFKNSQGMFRYIFGGFSAQTGDVVKDSPVINYIILAQSVFLVSACVLWLLYAANLYRKEKGHLLVASAFSLFALGGVANIIVNDYAFVAGILGGEIFFAKPGYVVNSIEYTVSSNSAVMLGNTALYLSTLFVFTLVCLCVNLAVKSKNKVPFEKDISGLFRCSLVYIVYLAMVFLYMSCTPYFEGYSPYASEIFWNVVAILLPVFASASQLIAATVSIKLFYKSKQSI